MIDLREYFYNKIKNEMDHWDMSDAYSITFFLYSNEAYTYKEYSNVCEFSISLKVNILEMMKVFIVKKDGIMHI